MDVRSRHGPRIAAVLLTVLALAAAGCGSSKSSSGGSTSTSSSPTSGPQAAAALANLQRAASDVLRETSYNDRAGAKRAIDAFARAFDRAKGAIRARSAVLATRIDERGAKIGLAIEGGEFAGAALVARSLQAAVNDAAVLVTGSRAGTRKGLLAVLDQMKGAAYDLSQEAKNRDAANTRKAYAAFARLFAASRKQIAAKDPGAATSIHTGLSKVQAALKAKPDNAKVLATTGDLLTAVNAVVAKMK